MGDTWHGVPLDFRRPIEGGTIDPEVVEYVRLKKEREALRARLYAPALDHVLGMLREGGRGGSGRV